MHDSSLDEILYINVEFYAWSLFWSIKFKCGWVYTIS